MLGGVVCVYMCVGVCGVYVRGGWGRERGGGKRGGGGGGGRGGGGGGERGRDVQIVDHMHLSRLC